MSMYSYPYSMTNLPQFNPPIRYVHYSQPIYVPTVGFASYTHPPGFTRQVAPPPGFNRPAMPSQLPPTYEEEEESEVDDIPEPVEDWKSAGTILIEEVFCLKRCKHRKTILLCQLKGESSWMLPYGRRIIKIDQSPADTARREMIESTANMFHISENAYSDDHRVTYDMSHQAFVVSISSPPQGIDLGVVKYNHLRIRENRRHPIENFFRFTNFTRIYIDDAVDSEILHYQSGDFMMFDVKGNVITICRRDACFIRDIIMRGYHKSAPVRKTRYIYSWDSEHIESKSYLDKTKSYYVM